MSIDYKEVELVAIYGGSGAGKDEIGNALAKAANERRPNSAKIVSTSGILNEIKNPQSTYPNVDRLREVVGDAIDMVNKGEFLPADRINPVASEAVLLLAQEGYRTIISPSFPRDLDQRKGLDLILEDLTMHGFDPRLSQFYLEATPDLLKYRMMVVRPEMLRAQGIEPREDDLDPVAVGNRVSEFFAKTMPVVEQERAGGKLITLDASEPLDVVQAKAIARFIAVLKA